jgi:uncharacterized protein YjiS (DUF1127 family)
METTMHFDEGRREREQAALEMYFETRDEPDAGDIRRGALRGIASALRRAMNRIGHELTSRHHERFLATLDDRMLADIGISRHEIPAVVRSGARRGRFHRDVP